MIVITLSLLLLVICIAMLWWFLTIAHYDSLKNVPGPKPLLPFVGNALTIGRTPQEAFKSCVALSKQYGEFFKIFIGPECKLIITDPEMMEKILTSTAYITKSDAYSLLDDWIGDGLITAKGEKWKRSRKLLTPCFHFSILNKFIPIFVGAADEFIGKLQTEIGGHSFDIFPYLKLSSLVLMCESSMGVKLDQTKENVNFVNAIEDHLELFMIRVFSVWQRFNVLFKFSPNYRIYTTSLNVLQQFANNIIATRREQTKKRDFHDYHSAKADDVGAKSKYALLDFLLKAEREHLIDARNIKIEINTFLVAGNETISLGLAYLFLMLSRHQDVQQKVVEDIVEIVGHEEKAISVETLQNMKYLDCVIKETMRLYPPIPAIERKLDSELTIGCTKVPINTTLSLFLYGLHHNGKYFPDPEKFDPSRFFPDNRSQRHTYCFLPFSAGPRNCIGQRFALLAIKVYAVKMLLKYKILPVEHFEPDLGLTGALQSFNGIHVRLCNRFIV